jgi:RimJ/RimL family protein N-acetyltransferase
MSELVINNENKVGLRGFEEEDIETLFIWQTAPGMRKYFRNPEMPNWEEHVKWCQLKLINKSDDQGFIIEYKNKAVGFVRVTNLSAHKKNKNKEEMEVSILLDNNYRKLGIAKMALEIIKNQFSHCILLAYIHPDNNNSVRLFTESGFKAQDNKGWYAFRGADE